MDQAPAEEILKKVIAIPTVNDNEKEVADYLASLFAPYEDQGVTIEELVYSPGRSNLIVTIGEGETTLGFSGHQDVVDPGDLADWDTEPLCTDHQGGAPDWAWCFGHEEWLGSGCLRDAGHAGRKEGPG